MPPAQQPAPDFGAPIPGPAAADAGYRTSPRAAASSGRLAGQRPLVAGVYRHHQRLQLYQAEGRHRWRRWGHAGSDSTHMEDFHNPDAPCAALTISLPCGASGTFCQASKWRSIAGPAGGPRKPLCMPAPWAGRTSRCTTALVRMEQQPAQSGGPRRARPGKQSVTRPASARRPLSASAIPRLRCGRYPL